MSMPRFGLAEGLPFVMPGAPDGARLRLDSGGGRAPVEAEAKAGEGIVVRGLEVRTYWLAYAPAVSDGFVPFGVLEVHPLHDPYEIQLRDELEALNERIRDGEGHVVSEADGDAGATTTRISLASLYRQRRAAEARLSGYLKAKGGHGTEGGRWG